jgi:hypothetical protein
MINKTRRGLQNLVTRSNQSGEAENPHRKFLRVATLELQKSLCGRVREAALRRTAEMDKQLADIAGQQAQLLEAVHQSQSKALPLAAEADLDEDSQDGRGKSFTLKY